MIEFFISYFRVLKSSNNLLKSSNNFFFLRFNLLKQGFIFYLSLFMEIGIYFDKENIFQINSERRFIIFSIKTKRMGIRELNL